MAPARKAHPLGTWDVPFSIVVSALGVLTATFLPMATHAPEWPDTLPNIVDSPSESLAAHTAELARRSPADADEALAAWRRLNEALERRDGAAVTEAQREFATRTRQVTAHNRDREESLRARACAVLGGPAPGDTALTRVAARHGLVNGASTVEARAARLSWCYLRWERLALDTPDEGPLEPITATLARVPRSLQLSFVRWVLGARCWALVGLPGRAAQREDPQRCAQLRTAMLPIARGVDPRYPSALAEAHIALWLGEDLRHVAATAPEGSSASVTDEARGAFQQAFEGYSRVLDRAPSRRVTRFAAAALAGMSRD